MVLFVHCIVGGQQATRSLSSDYNIVEAWCKQNKSYNKQSLEVLNDIQ